MTPTLLLTLLAAAPAGERTLPDRAREADRIALVKVLDSSVQVPDGNVMKMVTLTRLEVERELKGQGPKVVELVQLGGTYGPWERHVPGDATFQPSERAVVFLRCKNAVRPDRCILLGLSKGKLPMVAGAEPAQVMVPTPEGPVRRPLETLLAELSLPGTKQGDVKGRDVPAQPKSEKSR